VIGEALHRMENAERGFDDPLESDIAFHLSVLDASENRFFGQLGRIIDTTLRVSIRFTNMRTGVNAGSHDDHKRIYDAIVAGDSKGAEDSARELMQAALDTIILAQREEQRVSTAWIKSLNRLNNQSQRLRYRAIPKSSKPSQRMPRSLRHKVIAF